jgi:hypothetical protein
MGKPLHKLQSGDPILNRIQDALIEVLNPLLRENAAWPPRCTSRTRPAAGSAVAGKVVRVKDDGMPEQMQCCLQRSNGDWEWVVLAISSF